MESLALLMGLYIGTTTLEICLAFYSKAKHMHTFVRKHSLYSLLLRYGERREENNHYKYLLGFRPDTLGESFLTKGL